MILGALESPKVPISIVAYVFAYNGPVLTSKTNITEADIIIQ